MERIARSLDGSTRETRVYDAIFRNSGGVFRSAFAIWQRQIARVEDGVLYLRVPETSDYEHFPQDLSANDLFLLVALLQHGGLTAEDGAIVMGAGRDAVQTRIDGLIARGIIEPDPSHPGYRIASEAAAVVHEALYRRNLV
jgi:hypothetical protein